MVSILLLVISGYFVYLIICLVKVILGDDKTLASLFLPMLFAMVGLLLFSYEYTCLNKGEDAKLSLGLLTGLIICLLEAFTKK